MEAHSPRSMEDIGDSTTFLNAGYERNDVPKSKKPVALWRRLLHSRPSTSPDRARESGAGKVCRYWLDNCLQTHSQCQRDISPNKSLPARIIEVGSEGDTHVR